MKNKFNSLNEEFNVDGDIVQSEVVKVDVKAALKEVPDDIKKEYDYTRGIFIV